MNSVNDIILIHVEDEPSSFARIEEIREDYKKNWYHVKLMLLQVPVQVVTWILRDIYIDGEEFTIDGARMRFEKITCPEDTVIVTEEEPEEEGLTDETGDTPDKVSNVISFADLKKRG